MVFISLVFKMSSMVEANNNFTFNLYSQLRDSTGNIFFSPHSISSVGAMLYEGARGMTADQIRDVFGFPKDNEELRSSFAELHQRLNKSGRQYTLHTANALWAEQTYRLLKEYVDTIKCHYGGEARNVDFVNDAEGSRKLINNWIDHHTEHRISDMLGLGSLDPYTRLVLTQGTYFKGDWDRKFKKERTEQEDFHITPDNAVKVPMMKMPTDSFHFPYTENERMQVLEMPFEGNDLSMLILLPKENDLASLEKSIDSNRLKDLRRRMYPQKVQIWMPRFKLRTSYDLNSNLKSMGMGLPFGMDADFSGMDGTQNLYVDQMKHEAYFKVDEEGAEAAAATTAIMGLKAVMLPNVFKADHPFMFLINERRTDNILFMGRFMDPR